MAIENNAHITARYASVCQVHGLVPIVEPDIDVVNGDHSLERAAEVSEKVLSVFFKVLKGWDQLLSSHTSKKVLASSVFSGFFLFYLSDPK